MAIQVIRFQWRSRWQGSLCRVVHSSSESMSKGRKKRSLFAPLPKSWSNEWDNDLRSDSWAAERWFSQHSTLVGHDKDGQPLEIRQGHIEQKRQNCPFCGKVKTMFAQLVLSRGLQNPKMDRKPIPEEYSVPNSTINKFLMEPLRLQPLYKTKLGAKMSNTFSQRGSTLQQQAKMAQKFG